MDWMLGKVVVGVNPCPLSLVPECDAGADFFHRPIPPSFVWIRVIRGPSAQLVA